MDDNLLVLKNKKVFDTCYKLMADEYVAFNQQVFIADIITGPEFHVLKEALAETSKDEFEDHYRKISNWLQGKLADQTFDFPTDPQKLFQDAGFKFITFSTNISMKDALTILIDGEDAAVKSYTKAYKEVKDIFPDLGQIFLKIIEDEVNHKLEFIDIYQSVDVKD